MGLAASQARLLLLTARKNDIESQMMSISNEKLSLSRQSAKLSQQYSDALNAQKLVWNTGTDSLDLSYSLLMTPNTLDGQYLLSNATDGSIIMDSSMASKLGLSTSGTASSFNALYPSAGTFVAKCMGVTGSDATTIINKANTMVQAGESTDLSSSKFTTAYNDSDVFSYLSDVDNGYTLSYYITGQTDLQSTTYNNDASTSQVLQFFSCPDTGNGLNAEYRTAATAALKSYVSGVCADSIDAVLAVLDNNYSYSGSSWDKIEEAANKARRDTINFYGNALNSGSYLNSSGKSIDGTVSDTKGLNGVSDNSDGGEELFLDVTQVIKTFLAYFDAECDKVNGGNGNSYTSEIGAPTTKTIPGSSSTPASNTYNASSASNNPYGGGSSGGTTPSTTIQTPGTTTRRSIGGTSITCGETRDSDAVVNDPSDDLNKDGIGDTYELKYYINMYNALKTHGWQINENISNSKYLQSQVMYGNISVLQLTSSGSWSALSSNDVNSPLETVADESGNDQAEAKYEAAKDELDYKESKLDIQMNDLDTERSAVETEVDSVQKIINKNIEGSFKLFQNA